MSHDQATNALTSAPTRRLLGEVLVDHGVLSAEELERALELQGRRGGRLGEVLLAEQLIRPLELVRALALQYGLEFVDLDEVEVDRGLAEELPEGMARRHRMLPLRAEPDGTIVLGMVNPADVVALDDARAALRRPIRPVMVDSGQLADAIARTAAGDEQVRRVIRQAVADVGDDGGAPSATLATGTSPAPIIRFVDLMIQRAVQERASDIHVDPEASAVRIRFRIDGVLHEVMHPPKSLLAGLISRIKVMAGLDIAEKRLPQDGRVSLVVGDRPLDLRVATVPTVHGEAAVLRLLRRDEGPTRVVDLGLPDDQFARLERCYRRPWGLLLVTGPTGSGKTTTLYSILRELNDPSRNLLTVEDPVEYRMDGVKQIQVRPQVGLTFANALRAMLRADPDIVLVGEIRDRETAVTAVEASLTGHLVLASIHTNDAASTPLRLLEMGVEPYLVTAGLRGVLAQRLARRLCEHCKRDAALDAEAGRRAGVPPVLLDVDGTFQAMDALGCPACGGTGYKGRFAICEFMDVDEHVAHLVLERAPSQRILQAAIEGGMVPMRDFGMQRVADGTTSLREVLRALG